MEVPIPENGILSRTLFNDDAEGGSLRILGGSGTVGAHGAYGGCAVFYEREAELTLGTEKKDVRAGAFVHMPPQAPHGILVKTPLAMLLLMMKQVRQGKAS